MHLALQLPELLRLYFIAAWEVKFDYDHRQLSFLTKFALVCKLWRDPALAILWKTISEPRLAAILTMYLTQGGSNATQNCPPLAQKLVQYAQWIHRIATSSGLEQLSCLSRIPHRVVLFPNLESVRFIPMVFPISTDVLSHFFSRSLRGLFISADQSPDTTGCETQILTFFNMVCEKSPCLTTLVISGYPRRSWLPNLCMAIQRLNDLTSLSLCQMCFSRDMFWLIGDLPKLRKLHVLPEFMSAVTRESLRVSDIMARDLSQIENSFPKLEDLAILSGPATLQRSLTSRVFCHCSLQRLYLSFRDDGALNEMDQFKFIPTSGKFINHLVHLKLRVTAIYGQTAGCLTLIFLQPLMSCLQLQSVMLYTDGMFDFDNKDMLSLVKYWPNLRKLLVGLTQYPFGLPFGKRLSLELLHGLALSCPSLEVLQLPFAHSVTPNCSSWSTKGGTLAWSMKSFHLGAYLFELNEVLVDFIPRLVAFLLRIFPATTKFDISADFLYIVGDNREVADVILRKRDKYASALEAELIERGREIVDIGGGRYPPEWLLE